jgi:hypothetical protein
MGGRFPSIDASIINKWTVIIADFRKRKMVLCTYLNTFLAAEIGAQTLYSDIYLEEKK